ncbi:hypothetical protein L6R52_10435 [Myxococcota bacterium]|nr:hypothetical protein [Myxococcota bacterium]
MIFFLGALGVSTGCSPDLTRRSALIAVRVVGLPPEAATVRAIVSAGGSSYRVEADVASFDGELVAESVPEGPITVLVEATTPTAILERTATTEARGPLTRVIVDFGGGASMPGTDGGVTDDGGADVPHYSNPIPHVIRNLRPSAISGGALSGSEQATQEDAFPRFVESVTELAGAAPAGLGVRSVSLTLLTAASVEVNRLDELWSDEATVSFVSRGSGGSVTVARGPVSETTSATLAVTTSRTELAPLLTDLLGGNFDVRISGPAAWTPGEDDFSAEVRVSIVYEAWDR